MEFYILTIILIVILIIIGIFLLSNEDYFIIIALILIISVIVLIFGDKPNKIHTFSKSSDTEWEEEKDFHSAGTTIDTLYFNNKRDTIYRKIEYINIKL